MAYRKTVEEVSFGDPLTPSTRKERQFLLILSFLSVLLVYTGFTPSEISLVYFKTPELSKRITLLVIGVLDLYALVSFSFYAWLDYTVWKEVMETYGPYKHTKCKVRLRKWIDFYLPPVFGIVAVIMTIVGAIKA